MKTNLALFLLVTLIWSCSTDGDDKQIDPDNPEVTDTLVQSVQFKIGSKTYAYFENDTISFQPITQDLYSMPDQSLTNPENDSIRLMMRYFSQLMINYHQGDLTYGYPFAISFFNYSCPPAIPSPGEVLSIFSQTSWPYVNQFECNASNSGKVMINTVFPEIDLPYPNNTYSFTTEGIDQDDSSFEIQTVQPYAHQKYGDCLLLDGTFHAAMLGFYGDTIQLENGRFHLLVSREINW
jgi:hypothetical protein